MSLRTLNDEELERVVQGSRGILGIAFLDYESIPCIHFRPELEHVAEVFQDKMDFYELNVTENPDITERCRVDAVPTLLICKDYKVLARYEGPYSREALLDRLSSILGLQK